ncbi:MAG: dephospho-CoA kinase [Bacteroidales bacterium]|nr:dephospho-CoA kinase [Bacteroidales bacterium]
MKILALTGGIGSGKSTVAEIFRVLGVPVFDADSAAKELYSINSALHRGLINLFGEGIFNENNKPDNKLLASIVFNDPVRLNQLNALVHPAVIEYFGEWKQKHKDYPLLVHETALLYEAGLDKHSDYIAVVTADESLRIERVCRNKGWTPEQVKERIRRQFPQDLLESKADFVINNDGRFALLPQVTELIKKIQNN